MMPHWNDRNSCVTDQGINKKGKAVIKFIVFVGSDEPYSLKVN